MLPDEQLAPCWPAARASYRAAVERLARDGAEIVPIRLDLLGYSRQAQRLIAAPEIAQAHEALLRTRGDEFSDDIRTMLEQGAMIPAIDYLRGQRLRRLAQEELRGHFRRVDALLTPTCIGPAPRIGEKTARLADGVTEEPLMFAFARYTTAFSVPGAPAISVPAGVDEQGLPLGLQIAGRPFDESTVLRVAAAWERLAPWQDRIPPIAAV
jgi:aspartyl-tRNA(Asn)/glutamyl-tRNA(Gln) amidotransferase subunit A